MSVFTVQSTTPVARALEDSMANVLKHITAQMNSSLSDIVSLVENREQIENTINQFVNTAANFSEALLNQLKEFNNASDSKLKGMDKSLLDIIVHLKEARKHGLEVVSKKSDEPPVQLPVPVKIAVPAPVPAPVAVSETRVAVVPGKMKPLTIRFGSHEDAVDISVDGFYEKPATLSTMLPTRMYVDDEGFLHVHMCGGWRKMPVPRVIQPGSTELKGLDFFMASKSSSRFRVNYYDRKYPSGVAGESSPFTIRSYIPEAHKRLMNLDEDHNLEDHEIGHRITLATDIATGSIVYNLFCMQVANNVRNGNYCTHTRDYSEDQE